MDLVKKMENLENSLQSISIGLQNVYDEFKKFSAANLLKKIDEVNERLDHYEKDKSVESIDLKIKKWPLNIRINFNIITNFGSISTTIDYPPAAEYKIAVWIDGVYTKLLKKLYDSHEERGGKYIGEPGFKEFLDTHGKTIVKEYFQTTLEGSAVTFSSKGAVTGYDSGLPGLTRFSGAAIIDDAHKPDEVHSDTIRVSTNVELDPLLHTPQK